MDLPSPEVPLGELPGLDGSIESVAPPGETPNNGDPAPGPNPGDLPLGEGSEGAAALPDAGADGGADPEEDAAVPEGNEGPSEDGGANGGDGGSSLDGGGDGDGAVADDDAGGPQPGQFCVEDRDCPENQFCDQNECKNAVVIPGDAGTPPDAGAAPEDAGVEDAGRKRCQNDADCPSGLFCQVISGACLPVPDGGLPVEDAGVTPPDAGVTPPDAGVVTDAGVALPDAGVVTDAGVAPPDAGVVTDAGVTPPDAGVVTDAGVAPPDAGVVTDAGVAPPDAGVATDAGVVTDGGVKTDGGVGPCQFGCCAQGESCTQTSQCCATLTCMNGKCKDKCTVDTDCGAGEKCDILTGKCVPKGCTGNSDCQAPKICSGGTCVDPPPPVTVKRCEITTPPGVIHQGEQKTYNAVAYDAQDNVVPGQSFTWSTGSQDIAFFADPTVGVATGGTVGGTTQVGAKVTGTSVVCPGVPVTNFPAPPPDKIRVIARDGLTQKPLAGATVQFVIGNTTTNVVTDGDGAAEITGAPPATVTVYEPGHTYVTLVDTPEKDILIFVPPVIGDAGRGAIEGTLDFSKVTSTGQVRLGAAGLSYVEDIMNLTYEKLLGPPVNVTVTADLLPGIVPPTTVQVPIPQGIVVNSSGKIKAVKDQYRAQAPAGRHATWALAGRMTNTEFENTFINLFLGNPNPSPNQILAEVFKFLGKLTEHDTDADYMLQAGITATKNHQPKQNLSVLSSVTVPTLPKFNNVFVDTAFVVSNAFVTDRGIATIGINAGSDDANPTLRDGLVNPGSGLLPGIVNVKSAPLHSGLEGSTYAMAVLAQPVIDADTSRTVASALIYSGQTLPGSVSFANPFLGFSAASTFARTSRALSRAEVAGATFYRVVYRKQGAEWLVYLPLGTANFTLPAPPNTFADRSNAEMFMQAVGLKSGSLNDLVRFSGTNMDQLAALIDRYSTLSCSTTVSKPECDILP